MKAGRIREGQLKPLAERVSEVELDKRQYRINARRQMAMGIGAMRQATNWGRGILSRGFWGRLKFAFTGR